MDRAIILVSYIEEITLNAGDKYIVLPFHGVFLGRQVEGFHARVEGNINQDLLKRECVCKLLIKEVTASKIICELKSVRFL